MEHISSAGVSLEWHSSLKYSRRIKHLLIPTGRLGDSTGRLLKGLDEFLASNALLVFLEDHRNFQLVSVNTNLTNEPFSLLEPQRPPQHPLEPL